MRDVELLLRLVAWMRFAKRYVGNMRPFLDEAMKDLNDEWIKGRVAVEQVVGDALAGAAAACALFGSDVARKFKAGKYERAVNCAVFELQALTLVDRSVARAALARKQQVMRGFERLCTGTEFLASLEATTKSIENYQLRFDHYSSMLTEVIGRRVSAIRFGQ